MTPVGGARLASILFILCGSLVAAAAMITPLPSGSHPAGLIAVGVVAVAFGAGTWRLPWNRWPHHATLLVDSPVALGLVAAHNWSTGLDGFRYGLFFLVLFAWVGLAHPPGTSLRLSPALVAAYLGPLLLAPRGAAAASVASLLYVVPTCLLVGETSAAGSARLRSSEAALRASEARWRSLVMHASDLIVVLAADGHVKYATPAVSRLLGYDEASTVGMQVLELIHPDDLTFVVERLGLALTRPGPGELIEFRVARADGTYTWVESIGTNLLDEPDVSGIVCNVRDISDRKSAERALLHRARHDALTGLPNRQELADELTAAAAGNEPFALLLLDLDHFKEINDGLGHETGDRVLVEAGRRLRAAARPDDVVARLGGDEFAVIARGALDEQVAGSVADRLRHLLDAPFELDGMGLHVRGSIGIALAAPAAARTRRAPEELATLLLQQADVAMYRAKSEGLGWTAFGAADEQDRPERLAMVSELRAALDEGEVAVHFQPQVDLSTGRVRQLEVLARWNRNGVAVRPDEFIPLAEQSGLIRDLTASVLDQALDAARAWKDGGLDVAVAVNISAPTLRDPHFVDRVVSAVERAGVAPGALTLEITEGALADQTDSAVAVLQRLRGVGVRLSIDDFGSGYSSMAYLKRLPIDELKIDRAFIVDLLRDDRDEAITRTIVELAHSLGLSVVGEGVESAELEQRLRAMSCDSAQGYGLCRPLPFDEVTAWLRNRSVGASSASETRLSLVAGGRA